MSSAELRPYPFTSEEAPHTVENAIFASFDDLLQYPQFDGLDRTAMSSRFQTYFTFLHIAYREEASLRADGIPGANLYYHGQPHALQTTYDAITFTRGVVENGGNLSPDGAIAAVSGAMYHDSGFVSDGPVDNYASRSQIHVDESRSFFSTMVDLLGMPRGFDSEKIKRLGAIGIHATHFPFSDERVKEYQAMVESLPEEEREEAEIVAQIVELADLGGQCARPDYPSLIVKLRDELEAGREGSGIEAIGTDRDMIVNRELFLTDHIRHQPGSRNPETIALALFGPEMIKPFQERWFGENK